MLVPLYQSIFRNSFISNSSLFQLEAAHLSLVATNIFCALSLKRKEAFEYLGQVNLLAFITVILIVPLHITNEYLPVSATINNIYLALLSLLIIKKYIQRMKYAGIIGQNRWVGSCQHNKPGSFYHLFNYLK